MWQRRGQAGDRERPGLAVRCPQMGGTSTRGGPGGGVGAGGGGNVQMEIRMTNEPQMRMQVGTAEIRMTEEQARDLLGGVGGLGGATGGTGGVPGVGVGVRGEAGAGDAAGAGGAPNVDGNNNQNTTAQRILGAALGGAMPPTGVPAGAIPIPLDQLPPEVRNMLLGGLQGVGTGNLAGQLTGIFGGAAGQGQQGPTQEDMNLFGPLGGGGATTATATTEGGTNNMNQIPGLPTPPIPNLTGQPQPPTTANPGQLQELMQAFFQGQAGGATGGATIIDAATGAAAGATAGAATGTTRGGVAMMVGLR